MCLFAVVLVARVVHAGPVVQVVFLVLVVFVVLVALVVLGVLGVLVTLLPLLGSECPQSLSEGVGLQNVQEDLARWLRRMVSRCG